MFSIWALIADPLYIHRIYLVFEERHLNAPKIWFHTPYQSSRNSTTLVLFSEFVRGFLSWQRVAKKEKHPIFLVELSSEYEHVHRCEARGILDHQADDTFLELDETLRHRPRIMTNVWANLLDNKDHLLVINRAILDYPQRFLILGSYWRQYNHKHWIQWSGKSWPVAYIEKIKDKVFILFESFVTSIQSRKKLLNENTCWLNPVQKVFYCIIQF